MKVSKLITYPLKSAKFIPQKTVNFSEFGFYFDRCLALVDEDYKVVTARECPALLKIKCTIEGNRIYLENFSKEGTFCDVLVFPEQIQVNLFSLQRNAYLISNEANKWLQFALGTKVKLISFVADLNNFSTKLISFMDEAPIHLINEASITHLNIHLNKKVSVENFRPNIVVSCTEAYREDFWEIIQIGDTKFEVLSKCPRCSVITLVNNEGGKNAEVLKLLSSIRKEANKVNFGIYLKPLSKGTLKIGDTLKVLK